jgi:hypothetical protein
MPAALVSMAGTTTSVRACGGRPSSKARRGSGSGCSDSLIKRLRVATTASLAGTSSSSAVISQASTPAPGAAWCAISHAVPPRLSASTAAR